MTDEVFQERLAEIEATIGTLPQEQRAFLDEWFRETKDRHELIKRNISAARNALDDWRLAMKYKIFDLEARQREAAEGSE